MLCNTKGSIGRVFGPEFLLMLYLSGAVGSTGFYLGMMSSLSKMLRVDLARIPGLGASGAVNCIMLFDIITHPRYTLYLDFIIPFPAILLGILIIRKDYLRINEGDLGRFGHYGGAAVASTALALCWLQRLFERL